METEWRPIRPSLLTESQRTDKIKKDSEYEVTVQNLSAEFYGKKRTAGVTAQEEADYKALKAQLWGDYLTWAKANGLYEQVTPAQQLTEAETDLNKRLEDVNIIRVELGQKELEVKEKTIEVIR